MVQYEVKFEVYSEDDMNELYWVKVKFFSNSIRKNPPSFNAEMGIRYSPHLVVKGDEEYLGVTFTDGDACVYDKEIDAIVVSLYEGVGYHKLVKGAEFLIMEGPHIVGEGMVKDVEVDIRITPNTKVQERKSVFYPRGANF